MAAGTKGNAALLFLTPGAAQPAAATPSSHGPSFSRVTFRAWAEPIRKTAVASPTDSPPGQSTAGSGGHHAPAGGARGRGSASPLPRHWLARFSAHRIRNRSEAARGQAGPWPQLRPLRARRVLIGPPEAGGGFRGGEWGRPAWSNLARLVVVSWLRPMGARGGRGAASRAPAAVAASGLPRRHVPHLKGREGVSLRRHCGWCGALLRGSFTFIRSARSANKRCGPQTARVVATLLGLRPRFAPTWS